MNVVSIDYAELFGAMHVDVFDASACLSNSASYRYSGFYVGFLVWGRRSEVLAGWGLQLYAAVI